MFLGATLFCAFVAFGQQQARPLVSADVKEVSLKDFIAQLEKQTGWRFYYDSTKFDSIQVTVTARQQPLQKVLDDAFAGKDVYYAVDEAKNIFITRGRTLNIGLPAGFFSGGKGNNGKLRADTAWADDKEDNKPVQTAGLENKLYEIGDKQHISPQPVVTVAGYVKDAGTGEPVVGASVYVEKTKTGVSTDQYGLLFSIHSKRGGIFSMYKVLA